MLIFYYVISWINGMKCGDLREGQFVCQFPPVSTVTQEYETCSKNNTASAKCAPLAGIKCVENGQEITFNGTQFSTDLEVNIPCRWTNGMHYSTATVLSLFLGVFGIDRFYLGYPVLGIIKLSTFGMLGIGALTDFLLITLQVNAGCMLLQFYHVNVFFILLYLNFVIFATCNFICCEIFLHNSLINYYLVSLLLHIRTWKRTFLKHIVSKRFFHYKTLVSKRVYFISKFYSKIRF
jgi:hypothetical protein